MSVEPSSRAEDPEGEPAPTVTGDTRDRRFFVAIGLAVLVGMVVIGWGAWDSVHRSGANPAQYSPARHHYYPLLLVLAGVIGVGSALSELIRRLRHGPQPEGRHTQRVGGSVASRFRAQWPSYRQFAAREKSERAIKMQSREDDLVRRGWPLVAFCWLWVLATLGGGLAAVAAAIDGDWWAAAAFLAFAGAWGAMAAHTRHRIRVGRARLARLEREPEVDLTGPWTLRP